MRKLASLLVLLTIVQLTGTAKAAAAESPYLYGIHDHSPDPSEYLNHIKTATGAGGWITATVAVGANPNDTSGTDFTTLANAGHTIICRINYGYYPDGTIPVPAKYDDFATRCKNFVAHSPGCNIWLIGNELNLSAEWPFDGARFNYVSPQDYATCFRKACNAIKSIHPNDKVLPQATALWGGPYGAGTQSVNGTNYPSDGQPLTWVQFENQVLTAIAASGTLDGIALHVGSRGYNYSDIHNTATFGNLGLYASFYVYKDWVDYAIPSSLYNLPLYVTECNGYYYWKGGHPEAPSAHYEAGWMQEIYAEINRYNQVAATTGKPIFRCFNLYRWCGFCDGWNIDGADNPYKAQILSDLDAAAAQRYAWPAYVTTTNPPPAPSGLTATVGSGNVTLNWTATPFATSYNVKRSTTSGGTYSIIASNLNQTTFINTSYTPNTTYYYCVSAINAFGESTNSSKVSATPTVGLPDVVVTTLTWTPAGPLFAPTNVVFTATVLNQGSAATPSDPSQGIGVGFLVDGVQYAWAGADTTSLAPGASVMLNASDGPNGGNYWTATPGTHTVTAVVDDINRFPEGNENNNTLDRPLTVYVPSYAINSGGSAAGTFAADAYWTGSANTYSVASVIDTTGVSNAAPQAVYQTERWGDSTYTFINLVSNRTYTVRLHFAEISPSVTAIGNRQFNVVINGTQVLTNFDIFAAAGGRFKAFTRQFNAVANAAGKIVVQFTKGASNEAKISGLEISSALLFAPPVLTNGNVVLTWQANPGKTYRVQYKANLTNATWTALGSDLYANSFTLSITNTVTGNPARFYRFLQIN
jgi:hypothetical protein